MQIRFFNLDVIETIRDQSYERKNKRFTSLVLSVGANDNQSKRAFVTAHDCRQSIPCSHRKC